MNKKKLIGLSILTAGGAAALIAASIPGAAMTVPDPVPGIVHDAEAFGTADAAAEAGIQEAVRRCMQEKGFEYTPADSGMALDLHARFTTPRLDVVTARVSGYEPATAAAAEPEPASALGQLFADPAFVTALNGVDGGTPVEVNGLGTSLGGCTGKAVTAIYGSAEDYVLATGWANNALAAATGTAMYDTGFIQAHDAWRECMSGTPYSFENPSQAVEAGQRLGGQEEIKLAVTDAACREDTDFHGRLDSVLDNHLTARMQELAPQIEKVSEIRTAAAARAAALQDQR